MEVTRRTEAGDTTVSVGVSRGGGGEDGREDTAGNCGDGSSRLQRALRLETRVCSKSHAGIVRKRKQTPYNRWLPESCHWLQTL